MAPSDYARKLASLATIAIILVVSAWLRPAQAPEWLPSHKLTALTIQPPGLRAPSVSFGWQAGLSAVVLADPAAFAPAPLRRPGGQNGLFAAALPAVREAQRRESIELLVISAPLGPTDVPGALRPEVPRLGENAQMTRLVAPRDPVANALVAAGRRTGSAFRTGVVHTGGAFRTAGRAIRTIF
jgi:hypothetical protein